VFYMHILSRLKDMAKLHLDSRYLSLPEAEAVARLACLRVQHA
jgi:hypothetical protein